MPQFVILHHYLPAVENRSDHFDLMFEREEELITWAVDTWPLQSGACSAIRLPNHRLAYLDFEGPLGENRGSVQRVDRGDCELVICEPGRYVWRVRGVQTAGDFEFIHEDVHDHRWTLSWLPSSTKM